MSRIYERFCELLRAYNETDEKWMPIQKAHELLGSVNEDEIWEQQHAAADALFTYIAELEAAQRWHVVADGEMPEDRATVLVAFTEYPENIDILTATYYKHYEGFGGIDNWWNIEGWHSGNVTHWMPLPEPPIVYGKEREE